MKKMDITVAALRLFRKIRVFALIVILPALSIAQVKEITIQAFDGKNGKALASQRLVVFGGDSAEAVRFHQEAFDLMTDKDGLAKLKFDSPGTTWIQVWTDGLTLCQDKPNTKSFSVNSIITKGLSSPNNCSSYVQVAMPGRFIVFARPATLREKMAR
jgi:hypothetical protein